jgi:hypothetical protein
MFAGWKEIEEWWEWTVPEHPTDMAGMVITHVGIANKTRAPNNATQNGYNIVVSLEEPSAMQEGFYLTTVMGDTGAVAQPVFIPGALIPAEGQKLYVGIQPNWRAQYGEIACGFRWPRKEGWLDSAFGKMAGTAPGTTWQSWDASASNFGSILDGDAVGAWWYGNLPVEVSSTGGTVEMDGNVLKFTVAASVNGSVSATYRVDGSELIEGGDSDDTDYGEPWSFEQGVRMAIRFRVTTAGSLTEIGTRRITLRWHDGTDLISGTVHLGDTEFAEGIGVTADTETSYLAKAVTEGSWMWLSVDARNPLYLRGHMWLDDTSLIGNGVPPIYDVQISRSDEADVPTSGNFAEIYLSAGNVTGANQVIEIDRWVACGGAYDCEWVTEKIGEGDGATTTFATSIPYKTGMLWFFVDGIHVRTEEVDAEAGTFRAKQAWYADPGAVLVARYLANWNLEG